MTTPDSSLRHDSFLQDARDTIRRKHLSIRTEESYLSTIRRFLDFHGQKHPQELGANEISAYLTHLATNGHVAASTQNVARNALLFLYGEVLDQPLGDLGELSPAQRTRRLPVVLTRTEVKGLLAHLDGTQHLMAALLYGSGLRRLECCRLRVKDIDTP